MKKLLLILALVAGVPSAGAFSLHGPLDAWQDNTIGYGFAGDLGGVMNLNGQYRFNAPVLYYSFDDAFLSYYGQKGVEAVEEAIGILNALPAMSSVNLEDFPLGTTRLNARAQALNLLDLRSVTLFTVLEEMGLTSSPRYVFTLRQRVDNPTPCLSFTVIRRNFDPATLRTTSFINGSLWTYVDIFCITTPVIQAWPINEAVDPVAARLYEPVSACFSQAAYAGHFGVGHFYTGLSRDDVGGLRHIYRAANQVYENAPPNTAGVAGGGGPWGTPGTGTNAAPFIVTAYRKGMDKVTFVRAGAYDALLGQLFQPITNRYSEIISTNGIGGTQISQTVERSVIAPDILFSAQDSDLPPLVWTRSATWSAGPVATETGNAGPGTVLPTVRIDYNIMGPSAVNGGAFLAETNASPLMTWAHFGSSTNITIFPDGASIDALESFVFRVGGGSQWTPPPPPATTNTTGTTIP